MGRQNGGKVLAGDFGVKNMFLPDPSVAGQVYADFTILFIV